MKSKSRESAAWHRTIWCILLLTATLWSAWSIGCNTTSETEKPDTKESVSEPGTGTDAGHLADQVAGQDAVTGQDQPGGADGSAADIAPDKQPNENKDPFKQLPDRSEGLTNTATDLKAVLENGTLAGACKAYEADPTDRKKMLLCGKWMFFYETFGTAGVPKVLPTLLLKHFGDELGPGFAKQGMVPDPYSQEGMPLGMADSVKLGGTIETMAYTCASCHFGQLPDGRYSVGAPNHKYEYGKQILTISVLPMVVTGLRSKSDLAPEVLKVLEPFMQKAEQDPKIKEDILANLLPLATNPQAKIPDFSKQSQIYYAIWPSGTMDFLIEPLPIDDKVHTVSKITALWDLPTPDEQKAMGMAHAMLSWTGGTVSLMRFLEGFVEFGRGDAKAWPTDKLKPLAEYIFSLRAPKNSTMPPADQIASGKMLFVEKGCIGCHGGPRGSGTKLYSYEEIGTDPGMKKWLDPELDGKPCCEIKLREGEPLTHKLKSPRLNGSWTMSRFLHNGALSSLEELFCLEGPRPTQSGDGLGTGGHMYTCDNLTKEQKLALIAYLNAH